MDIRKMLSKVEIDKAVKNGAAIVKDKLPVIFSASAIGCLGLAMYETAVATHKSDMQIAEEEARRAAELPLYENTKLTAMEKVELCWKNYIKAALYGGASVAFIVASERKSHERYLALMSAYELTRQASEERKDAEVDILGPEKAAEIDESVTQRMARKSLTSDIQTVGGDGEKTLFYEPYTATPFWATYEDILHAFNHLNYVNNGEHTSSVNDLLEALDLRQPPIAREYGWNDEDGMIEPYLDKSTLVDEDPALPATLIGYSVEPRYDYGLDKRQWR